MDVRTLCLAVLHQGEASGYEIKKAFEEGPFSHFQDASFGSIYPALSRLSSEGLVDCTQMAQEKRPDKKVYKLTDKGNNNLITSLLAPPSPDRYTSDFFFILYFAELLPLPQVIMLLDQRIAFYTDIISKMEDCDSNLMPAGRQFCHGLGLTVYKSSLEYLEKHREGFLEKLRNHNTSQQETDTNRRAS